MNKRKRKLSRARQFKAATSPLNQNSQQNGLVKPKKPLSGNDKPCFSFSYLTKRDEFNFNYFKHDKTAQNTAKAALIDKLLLLSGMPWKQIDSMGKKIGFEYIPVNELKFDPESRIPFSDDGKCMVFRFNEERYRLIGFKQTNDPTFYIVGFDFDYGAYNHGE